MPKYTIKDLQNFAEKHGGKCLSKTYYLNSTLYEWECEAGHKFTKVWTTLLNKNGYIFCKDCKYIGNTIEGLQQFAEKHGGKCLTEKYNKAEDIYKWSCKKGHIFERKWNNFKRVEFSCRKCDFHTIEKLKKFAEDKGGKCLSTKYKSIDDKYEWECINLHQWDATWVNVLHNETWCGECLKYSIDKIEKFLNENKEGKLIKVIEGTYLNSLCLLECEEQHRWTVRATNIIHANWGGNCPVCKKITIEDCMLEAEKWGGKCLDAIYVNRRTKMMWECKEGHVFLKDLGHVRNKNQWCSNCDTRLQSESMCREVLEDIFKMPFIKRRFDFMERLELDGYCENLQIAFEYNGLQHDKYIPHFHRNGIEDFEKQQERDRRKRELCDKNDITLITIPHEYSFMNPKKIEEFIINELENLGFGMKDI